MDIDTQFTIPPQVMSRLVGEETVLLDLASGMYFGLEGVGNSIWESISAGRSLADTAKSIVVEYDVDEEQARADVIEFVTTLLECGLLTE